MFFIEALQGQHGALSCLAALSVPVGFVGLVIGVLHYLFTRAIGPALQGLYAGVTVFVLGVVGLFSLPTLKAQHAPASAEQWNKLAELLQSDADLAQVFPVALSRQGITFLSEATAAQLEGVIEQLPALLTMDRVSRSTGQSAGFVAQALDDVTQDALQRAATE